MADETLPRTRAEAKAVGATRYFTGKPCKQGHVAPRKTSNKQCVACSKVYIHRWRVAHAERVNERTRARYHGNLAKTRKQKRETAKRLRRQDKARLKNRADCRNRYARRKGAEGKHTAADVANIRGLQKDRCAACRTKLDGKGHVDHIVALSNGGSNWPRNLQLLCPTCNSSKKASDPIIFMRKAGKLL